MIDGLISLASTLEWLVLLWVVAAVLIALSIYCYHDILNPMAAAVMSDVVLPCALSASAAYSLLDNATYGKAELSRVIAVSVLFALGVGVGCLLRMGLFDRLLTSPFRLLANFGNGQPSLRGRTFFLLIGIGAFGLMAALGGGGLLWLFAPRDAYMGYRSSVGTLWALADWCLMLWLIVSIWCPQPGHRVLLRVMIACCLAFLFGSKAVVLSAALVALMHHHLRVRRLSPWLWLGSSAFLLFGFSALLYVQSGGEGRWQGYFREYTDTVCRAFQAGLVNGDLGGAAFLSSLWGLVPRGLYPDKPYEYGVLLLHEQLFPGMAAKGNTPGVVPWTLAYMDFGAWGAVLAGVLSGRVRDAFYRAYCVQRTSAVMFVAYIQLSLWPFLLYASPLATFMLCGVLALTVHRRRSMAPTPTGSATLHHSK